MRNFNSVEPMTTIKHIIGSLIAMIIYVLAGTVEESTESFDNDIHF